MGRSTGYRVRVRIQGQLEPAWWSSVFAGLALADEPDGTTVISGELADQAALHGLLATIRDLGLPLRSVETLAEPGSETPGRDCLTAVAGPSIELGEDR